jgi:hypothetical protein
MKADEVGCRNTGRLAGWLLASQAEDGRPLVLLVKDQVMVGSGVAAPDHGEGPGGPASNGNGATRAGGDSVAGGDPDFLDGIGHRPASSAESLGRPVAFSDVMHAGRLAVDGAMRQPYWLLL